MPDDPLRLCSHGCLLDAKHKYCPWHGERVEKGLIGTQLDTYVIRKVISAAGAFGAVYYAVNPIAGLEAAIKVLRPPSCYDRAACEEFIGEVELMFHELRDCQEIVRVLDVSTRPWPHIKMAFVNGGSLHGLLNDLRKRREETGAKDWLSPSETQEMLLDIARALAFAHGRKVVHRDLKPHNVLLQKFEEDGRTSHKCKVVDWGVSLGVRSKQRAAVGGDGQRVELALQGSVEEATASVTRTKEGGKGTKLQETAGKFTLKYAPIEYFLLFERSNAGAVRADELEAALKDPRGDIYMFGLMAAEVLTGKFPYDTSDAANATDAWEYWKEKHRSAAPIPIKSAAKSAGVKVPRRFASAVRRCLEKDPARRFPSGKELLKHLTWKAPVWQMVAGSVTVLAAAIILWLVFFRKPPTGGDITSIWDNWSQQEATKSIYLERLDDAILPKDAGGDPKALGVVWVPGLEYFTDKAKVRPVVYSPPELAGPIRKLELQRWRRLEGAQADGAQTVEQVVDGAVGLKDAVHLKGRTYTLDFTAVARALIAEEAGALAGVLFALDGTYTDQGKERRLTQFFEIRVDPTEPTVAVRDVKLCAKNPDGELRCSTGSVKADEPLRLFVPPAKGDTPWQLAFSVDVGASKDTLESQGTVNDPGVFVAVDGKLSRSRLSATPEQREFGVDLATLFAAAKVRWPKPTEEGESLKIKVTARSKAQVASDRATDFPFEVILDAGPKLAPKKSRDFTVRYPRRAELVVEWNEMGALDEACELRFNTVEGCGGTSREPQRAWDELKEVKVERVEGTSREWRLTVELPEDQPFLETAIRSGWTLRVFARQRELIYTAAGSNARVTEDDGVFRIEELCLKAPGKPAVESFEVRPKFSDPALSEQYKRLPLFRWHAQDQSRLPETLQLVPLKDRVDDEKEQVTWLRETDELEKGLALGLKPFFAAAGAATTLKMAAKFTTAWGHVVDVPVEVVYDPKLPRELSEWKLSLDGREPEAVFANERSYHAAAFQRAVLRATAHADDYVLEATPSAEPSLGKIDSKREGDRSFVFDIREPPAKGIYKLDVKLTDAFGNRRESQPYWLYVHRDAPLIVLPPGLSCGEGEQTVVESSGRCDLALSSSDEAGLSRIEVLRGGSTHSFAEFGPTRKGDVSGIDLVVDSLAASGAATKVTLTLKDISKTAERIVVKAWSWDKSPKECVLNVRREPERLPEKVQWLGLTWVHVVDGEKDFYACAFETPRWFVKDPTAAPPRDDAAWLPFTEWDGKRAAEFAKKTVLGGAYLLSREEWDKVPEANWIQTHKFPGLPPSATDDEKREFAEFRQRLENAIYCGKGPNAPPVRVDQVLDAEFNREMYRGAVHLLGNVAELVETAGGGYAVSGGSRAETVQQCVADPRAPTTRDTTNGRVGFRLGVSHVDSKDGRRKANPKFIESLKRAMEERLRGEKQQEPPRPSR
jgi:serine/threonine protein kinase